MPISPFDVCLEKTAHYVGITKCKEMKTLHKRSINNIIILEDALQKYSFVYLNSGYFIL